MPTNDPSSQDLRLKFIGGGNMARAIVAGLLANHYPATRISVLDPSATAQAALRDLDAALTIERAATDADWDIDLLILAVKPQIMAQVCQEVAPQLDERSADLCVLSVAAGIRAPDIQRWLGRPYSVIRAMPNQGAFVGLGTTGLYASPDVARQSRDAATTIMQATGGVVWVDQEADIDSITAISGSGPAYFFLLMEILQNTAQSFGLADEVARQIVIETAAAAASLAQTPDQDIAQLRAAVTSPGGTTAAAIDHLLGAGFAEHFAAALERAKTRAAELAREAAEHSAS
ncbi:MAG: pyrroline-5-carboxylate reductase [Pseudomonadota bacterium]